MAFPLAEQCDQHVGSGDLVPVGALHVDRRPLHHPLEAGGRFRLRRALGRQAGKVLVEELGQFATDFVDIDAAGPQDGGRVGIVEQTEEQVLKRRILVPPLAGEREGTMDRLFEIAGEHGTTLLMAARLGAATGVDG